MRLAPGIAPRLIATILIAPMACAAQAIPSTVWGKWKIYRELPTKTISCWGDADAKKIIGTQIEYSARVFRWHLITVNSPTADERTVTADQFHDENSSPSSNGSQIDFAQLGITAKKATEISVHHRPASISRATTEIPGDNVLVRDSNTITFSVCHLYFEAKRLQGTK